jgi:hypothetical protein
MSPVGLAEKSTDQYGTQESRKKPLPVFPFLIS